MKKQLLTLVLMVSATAIAYSQVEPDAEGCKDHPMFNRMPGFSISACSENYTSLEVVIGAESKTQTEEGNRTRIDYVFNPEGRKHPSWLQIVKNYENAILKLGGKKIYADAYFATFKLTRDKKETWVMFSLHSGTDLEVEQYFLDILAKEEMKQEIDANELYKELNASGSVALYINFETGKWDILPESENIINELEAMLKANPSLKVRVEGHTDNTGTPAANKTLSENRAKSVVMALMEKGIDKSRLSSRGWGQESPIADNRTEDGRAKNRRVEIVKM